MVKSELASVMTSPFPELSTFDPVKMTLREIHSQSPPSLELLIRLACLLEVTAFKPGNVHPKASFENCSYQDFVDSAEIVSPILANSGNQGVGETILECVTEVNEKVGNNTNLGILLLMAPICAVPKDFSLKEGLPAVLENLTVADSQAVYEAINLSGAGGLGQVSEQDVKSKPELPLQDLMKLAAERDRIASEYTSGYSIILNEGIAIFNQSVQMVKRWHEAILLLHLELMARYPDTLISRKCGKEVADQSARFAREVLEAGFPQKEAGLRKFTELDDWLRSDGHSRNPGTTADLVAGVMLAGFRDKLIPIPTENSNDN